MAQMPNLDNASINLNSLRDHARKELVEALDSIRGKKLLVLDPRLSGPLALIAQTALLKEHGVENLYHLSSEPIQSDCKNVLYLVRPRVASMKCIAGHIRHDAKEKVQRQYSVFFMPRRTVVCEKILEEAGVLGDVVLGEYPLDLIPFEEDVLSLELDTAYRDVVVEGDRSALYYMARALMKLQAVYGFIPNIKGKGHAALQVADMMERMREEPGASHSAATEAPGEVDTLILLDRQVDMVTPLCTQLTYEGLVDEYLRITNGAVELEPQLLGQAPGPKKLKVPLNSTDKLFRELRDLNFGVVGRILREKATSIREDYKDLPQQKSVGQLKDFVKKLNTLPEMTRHTNLAQHLSTLTTTAAFLSRLNVEQAMLEGRGADAFVVEAVEEMIHKQDPLVMVLRMLCLMSLTSGGLPRKTLDYFRREILHSYGFEQLFTLNNLEKAGLLKRQDGKNTYPSIKKAFRLIVEQDDANPTDIGYTYSGYAPLSIRLVQHALKGGWRAMEDVMRALPGPQFEKSEGSEADGQQSGPQFDKSSSDRPDNRRSLVMVVFLGGVTFAEISALRFLSSQEDSRHDYIVVASKLVSGSTLMESVIDEQWKPSPS